jgi:2-succinyl-6-hydroxy-2,4-cyclohexadiene-1-carboxylate synthase
VAETLILLHGFSGTRRAWDAVEEELGDERYLPRAIDLPGHGSEAQAERPITFDGCVRDVLARAPERFALAGYSLGGRVAMHLALAAPERVSALTLIACNPGIEDPAERARRREHDERLADELERTPFEDFIERWRTQPLFAGDPPEVGALARADQRRNDPLALAAAMRGLGTGAMSPVWSRLGELEMPTTVVVGERDAKFLEIGRRMAGLIPGARLLVLPCGHAAPLQCPGDVALALEGLHPEARQGG